MVSTTMKEKKSSSWWYFVCSTVNLGLLIHTECAEVIINPAKGPKHKQVVEGYRLLSFFIVCP